MASEPVGVDGQSLEELVRLAGNADCDAERLSLLKQLRNLPDLDPVFAVDADKLIAFVEKWVEGKNLHFYSREVSNIDHSRISYNTVGTPHARDI
mgnify:CR=1 FL=1